MSTDNTFDYNSANYKEFLKNFRTGEGSESQLIVLAGAFTPNRKEALNQLKREVIGEAVEIDLAEVITPYEQESYDNIDTCLSSVDKNAPMLVFRNAEILNGVYTSFSSSAVKYGSPQEKYFIKKLTEIKAPVVLEFKELDELDRMITRKANAVILFKAPSSFIEKIVWKAQNFHLNGSWFLSPRPH